MEKKYQIFISSTYEDLRKEREKVIYAILKAGQFPVGMELFYADSEDQWTQIRRTIDSSDYYVLIIKGRYGSMTDENISYTEKEYLYAKDRNIPVLPFIVDKDASYPEREHESDPKKLKLLNDFKRRLTQGRPDERQQCYFWKNADDLAYEVERAINAQIKYNERSGWVKGDLRSSDEDIASLSEEGVLLPRIRRDEHEIARRYGDIPQASELWDDIEQKLLWNIKKQTYIDTFEREIVLDVTGQKLNVTMTTIIEFSNVRQGIIYYSASPRFETMKQAKSYKHLEFSINGIDLLDKIHTVIDHAAVDRQFYYRVKNDYPLVYEKDVRLIHKTVHTVPVNEYFHQYQLVFPCKNMSVRIAFLHNPGGRYRIRTGPYSSFNVHTYDHYRTEYRKGNPINTISIGRWVLPGSGYVVVMQDTGIEKQD